MLRPCLVFPSWITRVCSFSPASRWHQCAAIDEVSITTQANSLSICTLSVQNFLHPYNSNLSCSVSSAHISPASHPWQEAHYPTRSMNIALHMLSIEQHTSANHYGLLSRHGWGFVLKPERVRVFLKRKYKIKRTENAHLIKILSDISCKPFKNTIHLFFFLRRTAANYTTAILNAQPESSSQNKAKACSTLSRWADEAHLPSHAHFSLLHGFCSPQHWPNKMTLLSFLPFFLSTLFPFQSHSGDQKVTQELCTCTQVKIHIQNLIHRKGTTITQQFPQVQGLVLLTNI